MASIGDALEQQVTIRWVDIGDIASLKRAVFEVTPEGGRLELPRGEKGAKGDKGDPANPVRMGAMVNDPTGLPTGLGVLDANLCVPVLSDRSLRVWTGYGWTTYPNWFGVKGDTGTSQQVAVGSVTNGGAASVTLSPASSDSTAVLDFVLPQGPAGPPGEQGPVGPTASISTASDVDQTTAPVSGDVLRFNGTEWAPEKLVAPVGPFTLPASSFSAADVSTGNFSSTPSVMIGNLSIPAMPFAWRPLVSGQVEVRVNASLVNIEVRLGSASGPIVGLGSGRNMEDGYRTIVPYFDSAVEPGNSVGMVNANVATNLVVVAQRVSGGFLANWETTKTGAQLSAVCQPVVTVA